MACSRSAAAAVDCDLQVMSLNICSTTFATKIKVVAPDQKQPKQCLRDESAFTSVADVHRRA
jgi:hypothetical protein